MRLMITFRAMVVMAALVWAAAGCQSRVSRFEGKAQSPSMPLLLKVAGTKVLNSKNVPVTLRGVNAASLEWTSDGEGRILETVRVAIEDWHVNIIRLPLSQDRWFGKEPNQNDDGKAYRALVKEVVDLCSSKGCYVILDLHWSNAGQWGANIGQHSMPDRNSVTFWKDFAPVYANHPAVLFDLYNEPHDVTWDVWLNGGTIKDRPNRPGQTAKTFEAVGMQELLDTVRATGAKNVVIAGGLDWAYDFNGILDGRQLKDPNGNGLIYANHVYDNKGDSVFTWIADMEKASAKLPVIVSEFGGSGGPNRRRGWWGSSPSNAMGDDWLLHVLQAIQDHNWSFTAWDLHTAAGPTLISDWNYMPTPDFGVFVKQLLLEGKLPRYTPPDLAKLARESASTLPESSRFGGSELYGDWQLQLELGERQGSILSFSKDEEGKLVGQWINFRGFTELEDVRFKDNKLSFSQVVRFDKDVFKANFAGAIEGEKLSGTLTHGGTQSNIEANRSRIISLAVGNWEMNFKVGEREITATLVVKTNEEGKLTAEWQSQMGEHKITDVQYEAGSLTFKRKSKIQDREFESTFEGTIKKDTLSGIIKTEQGEIAAEGKLIGSALIGNWNLDVTSERGTTRQRLKVNRDMSGMYGTAPIEKVNLEGDKVSFKVELQFGQRKFEMNFEGKLDKSMLTGELNTFRGAQKVVGKKDTSVF
ncbi:MAG: glycoside hydrolase family 5 protein [Sedimentisphaerales bacterium]|nr:glycoside hydrolase family 5 protein [Sedimentisphaerales bacterium]